MSRQSNQPSKNPIAALQKPPIFKLLNRKHLTFIFKYLDVEDLSRLRVTCRRMNNAVEHYVDALQVFVDWSEDYMEPEFQVYNHVEPGFIALTLRTCSPGDFFYPSFPFKSLKNLYLSYHDEQEERINLSGLMQLKYLKVRGNYSGPSVRLSSSRLSNVTHIDIDDPDLCEKQVFPHLKSYNLDFDVSEFGQLNNTTETVAVKYAFEKSMDILLDKPLLERVSFTIVIRNMELLIFEQFNDAFAAFMQLFEKEINLPESNVYVKLKYNANYEIGDRDRRRWFKAWSYLGREDVLLDPNTIETSGKRSKIPINSDEYSQSKQEVITEKYPNLVFAWEERRY